MNNVLFAIDLNAIKSQINNEPSDLDTALDAVRCAHELLNQHSGPISDELRELVEALSHVEAVLTGSIANDVRPKLRLVK